MTNRRALPRGLKRLSPLDTSEKTAIVVEGGAMRLQADYTLGRRCAEARLPAIERLLSDDGVRASL